jgi:hypothetical protein
MKIKCDCEEYSNKNKCKKCGHFHYTTRNEGHYHRENDYLNDNLKTKTDYICLNETIRELESFIGNMQGRPVHLIDVSRLLDILKRGKMIK